MKLVIKTIKRNVCCKTGDEDKECRYNADTKDKVTYEIPTSTSTTVILYSKGRKWSSQSAAHPLLSFKLMHLDKHYLLIAGGWIVSSLDI